MWNLPHRAGSIHPGDGIEALYPWRAKNACRTTLRRVVLLIAPMVLLPTVWSVYSLTTTSAGMARYESVTDGLQCPPGVSGYNSDASNTSSGLSHSVDVVTLTPASPTCAQFYARIKQTYHDSRTLALLIMLSQTPTGQGILEYLLAMGAHFGDTFITWRDLRADTNVGANDTGGFIQLDSARHTERVIIRIYMAGILVHEAIESYFEVGEGIRDMGTRHADYVAQWFNGMFERELHALPYYHAQDPFYMPTENSAYRLTYDAWLNTTNDGRLYLSNPERCDLRQSNRSGRAWPPSDWWAEIGGFWFLGQGTDVTPVPNALGLSPAMLDASDLSVIA